MPSIYVLILNHTLLLMQVKGIKGASILIVHSPFDMVKGVAIDSLHVFFLDLLKYLFDKRYCFL